MGGVQQLEELSEGRLDVAFIQRPRPFLRGIDAVTMLTEPLRLPCAAITDSQREKDIRSGAP